MWHKLFDIAGAIAILIIIIEVLAYICGSMIVKWMKNTPESRD